MPLLDEQQHGAIGRRLAAELAEVESRFAAELVCDLSCVNDLTRHLEQYRGKMLRPTLVILGGIAVDPEQPLIDAHRTLAAVVEMVHVATLVHDDVLDESHVRRRGATVNCLRGNETAVMLGDYLISHAYHMCATLDSQRAARLVAGTTNTVCEGELLQLANRNNWSLDERTYFQIIERKTASLCGTSGRLGAMLAGFVLMGQAAGTYQISELLAHGEAIRGGALYPAMLGLVLAGAATKSALVPVHFWLPNAMAAPTPVSAYLHSATMVKAGLFLMARLHPALAGTNAWIFIVGGVGLFTMVYAAWVAFRKHDLKGLLAYSTVSHLGLITACLGFSTRAAVLAAIFHVFNHAAFKASLFMTAGIVDHEAGTRDIRRLGGLWEKMPIISVLGTLGACGMAGVPLFNGFLSKEMFFKKSLKAAEHAPFEHMTGSMILPIAATLGGVFSVAYSIRFVLGTFFGDEPDEYPGHPHDPSFGFWLPVAVLVVVTVIGGIAPNAVARPLVEFAVAAAATGSSALHAVHDPHIELWHGFNTPLLMSAIAFVGGAACYAVRGQILELYRRWGELRGMEIFHAMVRGFVRLSEFVTDNLENGSLQRYVAFVVATAIVAGAYPWLYHPFEFAEYTEMSIEALDVIGASLLIAGAVAAAVVQRQRMQALISVGIVGLILSLAFVRLSAPDLAMTQLSVEVVNVLLLLLALFAVPEQGPGLESPVRTARDAGLAIAAGGGVAFLAYGVMTQGYDRMADYFLANAYPLGHGTNVVNVILVDFRAFDTMGEISVLVIAALGISSMLEGPKPQMPQPRPPSREMFPMILSHVTRPLMALVLAAAGYIFLRGHNQPGGGFIAGLVATVALVLQYVAHGQEWAEVRMRVDFRRMGTIGVVIAILSGVGAWALGAPLLSQGKIEFDVAVFGHLKLVSTLIFDLGVFLAVVGAVMTTLVRIGDFNREESPHSVDPTVPPGEEDDPWKP